MDHEEQMQKNLSGQRNYFTPFCTCVLEGWVFILFSDAHVIGGRINKQLHVTVSMNGINHHGVQN